VGGFFDASKERADNTSFEGYEMSCQRWRARHRLTEEHSEEPAAFGIFMVKTVLRGHGDEIIDLAKVNLFR
jgi:hypothetical protein